VVRKLASVLEAAAVGVPVGGKGERVKVYRFYADSRGKI
jgi:acyl-coenzyme A synthetase/AMP-(fatty) acid ligase